MDWVSCVAAATRPFGADFCAASSLSRSSLFACKHAVATLYATTPPDVSIATVPKRAICDIGEVDPVVGGWLQIENAASRSALFIVGVGMYCEKSALPYLASRSAAAIRRSTGREGIQYLSIYLSDL